RVTYIRMDQLIWFHGRITAFFVILPGLLGWLIEGQKDQLKQKNFPISKVYGRVQLISFQEESVHNHEKLGLVDSLEELNGTTFSADRVSPVMRRVEEDPMAFTLKAA
ncbi:hypothetical protein ACPCYY_19275, partial [Bacillus pumilus]